MGRFRNIYLSAMLALFGSFSYAQSVGWNLVSHIHESRFLSRLKSNDILDGNTHSKILNIDQSGKENWGKVSVYLREDNLDTLVKVVFRNLGVDESKLGLKTFTKRINAPLDELVVEWNLRLESALAKNEKKARLKQRKRSIDESLEISHPYIAKFVGKEFFGQPDVKWFKTRIGIHKDGFPRIFCTKKTDNGQVEKAKKLGQDDYRRLMWLVDKGINWTSEVVNGLAQRVYKIKSSNDKTKWKKLRIGFKNIGDESHFFMRYSVGIKEYISPLSDDKFWKAAKYFSFVKGPASCKPSADLEKFLSVWSDGFTDLGRISDLEEELKGLYSQVDSSLSEKWKVEDSNKQYSSFLELSGTLAGCVQPIPVAKSLSGLYVPKGDVVVLSGNRVFVSPSDKYRVVLFNYRAFSVSLSDKKIQSYVSELNALSKNRLDYLNSVLPERKKYLSSVNKYLRTKVRSISKN